MPKDPVDFSYCILMTITYLNFAVIEDCTFRNVEGPVLPGCTGPFHISEGTLFKSSNLSFAYLHHFSHFISFCVYVGRGSRKKNHRRSLRKGRVYFQTLLLYQICFPFCCRLVATWWCWTRFLPFVLNKNMKCGCLFKSTYLFSAVKLCNPKLHLGMWNRKLLN
jgi:hypothetical protein